MKKIFENQKLNQIGAIIVILLFIVGYRSVFELRESEQAAAFIGGAPQRNYTQAGLNLKFPWESLRIADKRLLLHTGKELILQERTHKNMLFDYFTLFHIDNPILYMTKVGDLGKATRRIDDNLGSDIAAVIGANTLDDIVTYRRPELLDTIKAMSNDGLSDIALSLRFFSFNRVELPDENKPAVYSDMIADRTKISTSYQEEGHRMAKEITSEADSRARTIRSTAEAMADSITGKADGDALELMNRAYSRSKELFELYNEVETYKKAYGENTEWIIDGKNLLTPPK
ncbi:MAG: hypothetical protein LBO09_00720 [Candidatus Peribacteria bacterium]|jgi:regulator of protease activity HflC (stomatin/prohibitin superfamily)|nr:hypothetical protein [Candidatus Peribacteria bacterium]